MSTTIETNLNSANQARYDELEHQRDISSVLLLREMQCTQDLSYRQRLYEQAADQEESHISEVLNGTVRTHFDFDISNGKLYLLQPNGVTEWSEMHSNGKKRANLKAAINPEFLPYAQMASAELEESKTQEEIIRRGIPAALVKLSLSGNDVMSKSALKKIGRDPDLSRAFLRVSVFDGSKLRIYSRSIDGVNLMDGRKIVNGWGTFNEDKAKLDPDSSSVDILNTDIILDESQISVNKMHQLADNLVARYDDLQFQKTGKTHRAGLDPEGVDTYQFVKENLDLMNAHMDGLSELSAKDLPVALLALQANDLRYDIMASFKRRIEGTWAIEGSLAESVADAGAGERAAGTSFYGCDTVVSASSANVANSGYVNSGRNEKNLMDLSGKKLRCVNKSCKKEVVVPDKDLRDGKLSCKECGLVYDVCNRESFFRNVDNKNKATEESPMAKWNREYNFKKQQERLEKIKLTDNFNLTKTA